MSFVSFLAFSVETRGPWRMSFLLHYTYSIEMHGPWRVLFLPHARLTNQNRTLFVFLFNVPTEKNI